MTLEQARYNLIRLTQKQRLLLAADGLLWALAVAVLVFIGTTFVLDAFVWKLSFAICGGALTFFLRASALGLFAFNEKTVIRLINERYKEYEESTDLLFDASDLTTLQQLQQSKTLSRFSESHGQIQFPNNILKAFGVFLGAAVIGATVILFLPKATPLPEAIQSIQNEIPEPPLPSSIVSISLNVTPPAYTDIKSFTTEKLNITVPQGSELTWEVKFSEGINGSQIRISATDSIELKSSDAKTKRGGRFANESFIYQFIWQDDQQPQSSSDYYTIEVINDQPPAITVENLPQFSQIAMNEKPVVNLKSTLTDDYGLQSAHIVATVSKGSGESVKFREEKLYFSSPEKISGKSTKANRTIDLKKLGLEAGDELYFYIVATDNKVPDANQSRTETFFIALQDTASQETSMDAGLGVDLMPEYFRSQRQIIIDTEKLLRDRKKITTHQFKQTSNELGYDQKVLRLKYGEFLGEEFESGIGPQSPVGGDGAATIEEAVKQYGHTHDTENEHNLVEDKKVAPKEEHHHHEGEEGKEESPLEAFAHNHDDAEEATFFILSIRAKLKAALGFMWDAELYLRIYEPAKSLPYQYQALRLLKEISQDSRVYVHRTGFDPPPIKEESRLKGDISETRSTTDFYSASKKEEFPAMTKALIVIERMIAEKQTTITPSEKSILQQAGNELSGVALKKPGEYLKTLSLLQDLVHDKIGEEKFQTSLLSLRKTLWTVIPQQQLSPVSREQNLHELDRQFIENLPND